jgi:hypothetical protein
MYFRLILTLLFGGVMMAQAQTLKFSGRIINAKNEPLVGVSVKIVGTTVGTATDIDGRFILSLSVGKKI